MRLIHYLVLLLTIAVLCATAWADNDDILGTWFNQDKDAKIEIFKCGNDYCGKIVWLKNPTYSADSKEGTPGTPKLDTKNPDAAKRKTPLLDLQIVQRLQFSGDNQWKNGKIYDPDSGNTYSGEMRLDGADTLKLRGYIGVSLLGRSQTWIRQN